MIRAANDGETGSMRQPKMDQPKPMSKPVGQARSKMMMEGVIDHFVGWDLEC